MTRASRSIRSQLQVGRREPPFSLRLSFEERSALEKRAGNLPIATYIKSLLFAEHAPRVVSRTRARVKDTSALAEVLACLGASRIPNNLNQIAKAANSGSVYFDIRTRDELNAACRDIQIMRQLLMRALGLKVAEESPVRQSTTQGFARAAGTFEL